MILFNLNFINLNNCSYPFVGETISEQVSVVLQNRFQICRTHTWNCWIQNWFQL